MANVSSSNSQGVRVPKLRFPGFEGEWDANPLSKLLDFQNGINAGAEKYGSGIKYISVMDILDNNFITYSCIKGSVDIDDITLRHYCVEYGDILFQRSSETMEDVGNATVYLDKEKAATFGGFVIRGKKKNDYNPFFLKSLLCSPHSRKQIVRMGAGSQHYNIGQDSLSKIIVSLPPIDEQAKISTFLMLLDERIEKQCQLIEALKSYKRGALSKLFPQNGETTPEYRFAGFTEPWEQRKLGEVGKARSGVGFPDSEQGGAFGIPFFKVSDMNLDGNENEMTVANNYVTTAQIAAHRWSPIVELPAIFFAKVGAAVMLNRKRLCRFPFLLDNNTMAYSLDYTKWDADFAKALFETVDLTSLVQIGALPSYNAGDVEVMKICLPSLSEQAQIGAFFKKLDHLITLHQRKLSEYEMVKSGLLQQLFI